MKNEVSFVKEGTVDIYKSWQIAYFSKFIYDYTYQFSVKLKV